MLSVTKIHSPNLCVPAKKALDSTNGLCSLLDLNLIPSNVAWCWK